MVSSNKYDCIYNCDQNLPDLHVVHVKDDMKFVLRIFLLEDMSAYPSSPPLTHLLLHHFPTNILLHQDFLLRLRYEVHFFQTKTKFHNYETFYNFLVSPGMLISNLNTRTTNNFCRIYEVGLCTDET